MTPHGPAALYQCIAQRLPAHRALLLFIALWLLAVSALATRGAGTQFIPQCSPGAFSVKARLPAGATLEAAERAMRLLQQAVSGVPGIERAYAVAGGSSWPGAAPAPAVEVAIALRPPAGRAAEERAIHALRAKLGAPADVEFEITRAADAQRSFAAEPYFARRHTPRL
ncbi:MAG TPA: efflux RND transporter permease subunit [Steroidobacteraceae bacterium]